VTRGEAVAAWFGGWRDLYLGRVLDIQGRTAQARELYGRAAERKGFGPGICQGPPRSGGFVA